MNISSELAFFCSIVKMGSLMAVARELNLTPPSVSRRLAQLEERLGVRLLNRTTRRLSLTAEGEVYFNHAQPRADSSASMRHWALAAPI